jgi:ankyrin repeat protein
LNRTIAGNKSVFLTKMKRERVDLAAYAAACNHGSITEVQEFLDAGADVNESSVEFRHSNNSPIMLAYKHNQPNALIRMLIERGADVHHRNKDGSTALHFACSYGTMETIHMLLERGADVAAISTKSKRNMLHYAAMHRGDDDEVTQIAALMLLRGGMDVNARDELNRPALMWAVFSSRVALVDLLIRHGADVNATHLDGVSILMEAVKDTRNGYAMAERLLKAGANVDHVDKTRRSAFISAFNSSPALMKLIAGSAVDNKVLKDWFPGDRCPDPFGCISLAVTTYGHVAGSFDVTDAVRTGKAPHSTWARFRQGKPVNYGEMYIALASQTYVNAKTWYRIGCEMQSRQEGDRYETILHVACRSPTAFVALPPLMRLGINPLLRDAVGRLPLDVCLTNESRNVVRSYMVWQPTEQCTRWWGPYFEQRAHVFMLVCKRWKNVLPRDVRYKIVRFLAEIEMACVDINVV